MAAGLGKSGNQTARKGRLAGDAMRAHNHSEAERVIAVLGYNWVD